MIKIGFTGTRFGMTVLQYNQLEQILQRDSFVELHHGDCVGADAQAHAAVIAAGGWACIHPPVDESHRAFCKGSRVIYPAQTHFARNRTIVINTELLIATPLNEFEESRGGTWYTVNFARSINKEVWIIWPSGIVSKG